MTADGEARRRPEDLVGRRLGPYEIVRLVGRGGMGTVYEAWASGRGERVALKVLFAAAAADGETVSRFRREARVLARIRHPNVVRVYGLGRAGRLLFLAQEFVDGTNYERIVEDRGPLPLPDALGVVAAVAAALEAVHAQGIIHRDLKPSNVMRRRDGVVKVLDFGIAKPLGSGLGADITRTGVFLGTLGYCAPEQIRGGRLSPRSDLYALGATLYFLLTGEPPHRGEDTEEIVRETLRGRFMPIRKHRPDLADPVVRLVAGLLHPNPARRPGAAEQVRARLEELRAGLAGAGRSPPRPRGLWARLRAWWRR